VYSPHLPFTCQNPNLPDREVAAAAAAAGHSPAPMASNAIPPPSPHQGTVAQGVKEGGSKEATLKATELQSPESTPSWSSMLGLWAWDKNAAKVKEPTASAIVQHKVNETAGKP
jgi:hypothetical protein